MNCPETKNLWGPHHDGELDTILAANLQQHLDQCPECRRFYAAQKQFETALACSLKNRQATPALWQQEEAAVRAAFAAQAEVVHTKSQVEVSSFNSFVSGLSSLLWPNPQFYVGLVTVWIGLLGLNWSLDSTSSENTRVSISTPQQQAELAEQRRVFQTLLMANEQSLPESGIHPPMIRPDNRKPQAPKSPKAELRRPIGPSHPDTMLATKPPANLYSTPA